MRTSCTALKEVQSNQIKIRTEKMALSIAHSNIILKKSLFREEDCTDRFRSKKEDYHKNMGGKMAELTKTIRNRHHCMIENKGRHMIEDIGQKFSCSFRKRYKDVNKIFVSLKINFCHSLTRTLTTPLITERN